MSDIAGNVRPTRVTVDLAVIRENLAAIRAHVGNTRVMPILKANAYGHGLVEIARAVEANSDALGVAYLEEGILLRQAGITAPILVLGGIIGSQIPLFLEHRLSLCASSVDKLTAIDAEAASLGVRASVHLKIDTGMERLGVHWYSAGKLLEASLACAHVDVDGIFSHFANSDAADLSDANRQLDRFHTVLRFYEDRSLPVPMRHMANSGAVVQLPASWLDMVRPGILLYGVYPGEMPRAVPVRPALTWTSRVVYFKVVEAGNAVSYGSTWAPDHRVRVVTVPVGYGDGYFRAMSNKAIVGIRGHRYAQVGRICMDQIVVNLDQGEAWNGDEVLLLGRQTGVQITAEDLAKWADTIPYEVLTNINTRVPRVYL
jgi:alanine racemase